MRVQVPTSVVDNTYEAFPQGYYDGQLDGVEIRRPNGDDSWIVLTISVEDITPREGTENPGRSRFRSDITLQTDGISVLETQDLSDVPFPIRRASGLLAGLAEGLGVATRENGVVDYDPEAVVDALANGQFAGERVSFGVSHYKPKNADNVRDQFERFGSAS